MAAYLCYKPLKLRKSRFLKKRYKLDHKKRIQNHTTGLENMASKLDSICCSYTGCNVQTLQLCSATTPGGTIPSNHGKNGIPGIIKNGGLAQPFYKLCHSNPFCCFFLEERTSHLFLCLSIVDPFLITGTDL